MIKVAIVEDEDRFAADLQKCLETYSSENNYIFQTERFKDGLDFLETRVNDFDVVFLDIGMPILNGIDTAERLRKIDSMVAIVFITAYSQHAIDGYKVNALDYILKPIKYSTFALSMKRVLSYVNSNSTQRIVLGTKNGEISINCSSLIYLEIMGHKIVWHCENGEYCTSGTLNGELLRLPEGQFAKCSSCYLVNLRYVERVAGFECQLSGGITLPVARTRKKAFIEAMQRYFIKSGI